MAKKKKTETTPVAEDDSQDDAASAPLIFISHDSRDADLAEAFAMLLTDASGGILKSFRSSDRVGTEGIEFGAEWYRAIMQKLDEATDVVTLSRGSGFVIPRPFGVYVRSFEMPK
jgi:hypothetical protein